jgi:hypothetical protein
MAVITRDRKCVSCNTECLNCRDPGKKRKWQPIPDELGLVRIELINDILVTLDRIKNMPCLADVDRDDIFKHLDELNGWMKDA